MSRRQPAPAARCPGWAIARRRWLLGGLFLLTLAACGQPKPELTASEIAARTIAAVDSLKSAHFELTIDGGPAFIDPQRTINLRQAEGDLLRPDRAQTRARVGIGGLVASIRFINIGDRGFMSDPFTGRWGPLPPAMVYNPAVLFDDQRGISSLIKQIEGLTREADEKLDNADLYRLGGRLPNTSLAIFTGGVLTGDQIRIELLVEKETGTLRQLRLAELAPREGQKAPMLWTLTLTAHNQPVTIEPPA